MEAGAFCVTDRGLMAKSQYAGLAVAMALKERGLWRIAGDNLVLERLRDMAHISREVINACEEFDHQYHKGSGIAHLATDGGKTNV